METKIRQYVNYQFRFDNRSDIEELKEEIIGNLTDRYHEYLNNGKSPEDAYIEAIKSLGDFSDKRYNEIPDEYSFKPSVPDILLLSGAILSVFGLLFTFFSNVIGAIVTAISIILFSGAAYYLYSYSQYVRKQFMDIEKHNLLLTKIFKYMKTCFAFWALSLSFILASLIISKITNYAILFNLKSITFKSFKGYILAYIIFFTVAFLIFLLIFMNIYNRLMYRYYILTGSKHLKGKIRESYEYLYDNGIDKPNNNIFIEKYLMPIIGLIIIILQQFITTITLRTESYNSNFITIYKYEELLYLESLVNILFSSFWFVASLPIILLLIAIIFIILTLVNKIKRQAILILSYYIWLLGNLFFIKFIDINVFYIHDDFVFKTYPSYSVSMFFIFTIFVIIRGVIIKKDKTRLEER